jgi:DNA-binding transcriptional regulator YiaG
MAKRKVKSVPCEKCGKKSPLSDVWIQSEYDTFQHRLDHSMVCKDCVNPTHDAHKIGVLFGSPEQTISGLRHLLNKDGFRPVTFLRFVERIAEEAGLSFDMQEKPRDEKYERYMSGNIYKIHKQRQEEMPREEADAISPQQLKDLMKQEGLNQRQLALKLGVSDCLVSKCARGESNSLLLANKIRATFGKRAA